MSVEIEKYKQVWKKFQNKIAALRERRFEILTNIHKKFDQQKIASLRKKIKNNAR